MTQSRVLHITDLHLREKVGERLLDVDTDHSLERVLQAAFAEQAADALLITGDVAHDPVPAVYERCAELVARYFQGPILWLPGNHDLAAPMQHLNSGIEVIADSAPTLRLGPWHIVGLDSHVDDEVTANSDPSSWSAVKQACQGAGDAPVLLATHHPPLPVGCPWLDKDRIQNAHELLEWCAEHSNLRAMVFGHTHQRITARHTSAHGPVDLYGTPSTCFQFAPDSTSFAVDAGVAPGYRWLNLDSSGTLRTRVRYLDSYP